MKHFDGHAWSNKIVCKFVTVALSSSAMGALSPVKRCHVEELLFPTGHPVLPWHRCSKTPRKAGQYCAAVQLPHPAGVVISESEPDVKRFAVQTLHHLVFTTLTYKIMLTVDRPLPVLQCQHPPWLQ